MAWGAAIGAGLQVLSTVLPHILGGKKGGGQTSYETIRNNAVRQALALVEAGKQSGIHPLALLGSGMGGGGFASPIGGYSSSLGDAIGAGLGALGDAADRLYADDQDRIDRDRELKERGIERDAYARERALQRLHDREMTPERKAALKGMELDNELRMLDIAQSRTKLAAARAGAVGGTTGEVMTGPMGVTIRPDPNVADASAIQDKYDDWVSGAYGAARWLQDFVEGRVRVGGSIENPLTKGANVIDDFLKSRQYPGSATPRRGPN